MRESPTNQFLYKNTSNAVITILAVLLCAGTGCVQEEHRRESATAAVPEGVVEEVAGTLVASIEVEAGHAIRFYEIEPGLVVATESGELDMHPPLLAQREIDSYVDVFAALAPDEEVPQALLEAEARRDAPRAQTSTPQPPYGDPSWNGDRFSLYTTGEQYWFRQTFCPYGTPKCIQGWDWIDSGWDYTTDWRSTAMVGSEGSVAAPHIAYWWTCNIFSCWWQPFVSANVSPGHYHWISGSGGWFYFKGTLTGAGAGTQVSMAITDGPYRCAVCNDGACMCGYNVPQNLCSSHGGVNPDIGCIRQP